MEAAAGGICTFGPDLIGQPLRGSLRLQFADRMRILGSSVNGVSISHQWIARVVAVVGDDRALSHVWLRFRVVEPRQGHGIQVLALMLCPWNS
jgi:hypothetical protein